MNEAKRSMLHEACKDTVSYTATLCRRTKDGADSVAKIFDLFRRPFEAIQGNRPFGWDKTPEDEERIYKEFLKACVKFLEE